MASPDLRQRYSAAEQALLDAVLMGYGRDLGELRHVVSDDDFGSPAYAAIWRASIGLFEDGQPVEPVALESRLRTAGEFELVGGPGAVSLLKGGLFGQADTYADTVRRGGERRRYHEALKLALRRCAADDNLDQVDEWAEFSNATAATLVELARTGRRIVGGIGQNAMLVQTIEEISKRASTQEFASIGCVPSDEQACPIPGDLVLEAGRPSMGKTALLTSLVRDLLLESDGASGADRRWRLRRGAPPVLFASAETPPTKLNERVLSDLSSIDGRTLARPPREFLETAGARFGAAAAVWRECPVTWMPQDEARRLERIEAHARAWRRENPNGCGIIGIDYLGYLDLPTDVERNHALGYVAKRLKNLAKDLGVIVILLVQLNRGLERRDSKWPTLADLRDSGELEQDADIVLFVHRPVRFGDIDETALAQRIDTVMLQTPHTDEQRRALEADQQILREAWVVIAKARNGQVGRVRSEYFRQFTRFTFSRTHA